MIGLLLINGFLAVLVSTLVQVHANRFATSGVYPAFVVTSSPFGSTLLEHYLWNQVRSMVEDFWHQTSAFTNENEQALESTDTFASQRAAIFKFTLQAA